MHRGWSPISILFVGSNGSSYSNGSLRSFHEELDRSEIEGNVENETEKTEEFHAKREVPRRANKVSAERLTKEKFRFTQVVLRE